MANQLLHCPICDSQNVVKFLNDRPDYEFNVKFNLQYYKCLNENCGLVFVPELPSYELLGTFYKSYTTHLSNVELKKYSIITRINRNNYIRYLMSLFKNKDLNTLSVLDYGSGNGNLLKDLAGLGINNAVGYDFDPVACEYAQHQGLKAYASFEEVETYGPFDYIFLNHVIEHLPYPLADIKMLTKKLRPGGKIVLRTPNNRSFLSHLFGKRWRGWETPRHLHIFNVKSIFRLTEQVEGLQSTQVTTSNFMFSGFFNESLHSKYLREKLVGKLIRKVLTYLIVCVALVANLSGTTGEELCVIIQKK